MLALDKILNIYSLAALNVAIVLLAEFVGDGKYFFESGIIHIIAILFIILAISRSFMHYYTYDPSFEKFLHASIAALLIFAASHFIEYLTFMTANVYEDAVFANVANMYIMSLLVLIIGGDIFMRAFSSGPTLLMKASAAAIAALTALTIMLLLRSKLISLEPDEIYPYIYGVALVSCGGFALYQMRRIRDRISLPHGFINYFMAATTLIIIAALINIFYEFLENILVLPAHQVIYLSHFAFYAALSLMFIAFSKLSRLGGILADAKRIDEASGGGRTR
ncbi:MAG: hypothetical protein HZA25_03065 [Candidatus Niyogibacteria bacterium]|nr:hypothetical protein [Candidatus Niyogibacteria bacterium]